MSSLDELFAQIPMDQIAAKLGVDTGTAEQAVRTALPALVGGMQANAQDPAGAASLTGALEKHTGYTPDNDVDLDKVNTDDGQKIVANVFGANSDQVMTALGGTAGGNSGLISKLLPMLAPLVMAWLAKRFMGGGRTQAGSPQAGSAQGAGGGIGDLLGGLLGGGSGQGGGIGDLLGGLLGGGRR